MKDQLNEGMGSINVEEEIDVSRIRVLAGLANSTTVAGTPVVAEDVEDLSPEQKEQVADAIESAIEDFNQTLEGLERTIRQFMPDRYRELEAYTFANIKNAIGGHGYMTRNTTLTDLVEELREDEEY
jgi:hypothetical protein